MPKPLWRDGAFPHRGRGAVLVSILRSKQPPLSTRDCHIAYARRRPLRRIRWIPNMCRDSTKVLTSAARVKEKLSEFWARI
jgi:hypothetical protein